MKITIICDVLGKENNGTTTAGLNLINYLIKKGHDVKVVCSDEYRKDDKHYVIVPNRDFGIFKRYVEKNGVAPAKASKKFLESVVKDSDIIHLLLPFNMSRKVVKIAQKYNIPLTASFHCQAENITSHFFVMNNKVINNMIYKVFYNQTYKYVDAVHYPTKFIKEVFEKSIKKETNAYVISNGVKDIYVRKVLDKPKEYKDKFVVVFTGRFSKEKSHKVLIDAVASSKFKDKIQLIFAGNGPLEKKLENYAKCKLPIQPIMKYFKREELVNILNWADLYVHPAEIEIEAIACLEAIACGLVPVIANSPRCATKAFALDEKNLFENKNSKDLANKIDFWLENKEEREKRSQEYLGYAKNFSFDSCMEQMEKMLNDTYKNKKRHFEN